jgi:hypothetical protein
MPELALAHVGLGWDKTLPPDPNPKKRLYFNLFTSNLNVNGEHDEENIAGQ